MASKLAILQEEEAKLLEIKEKLKDQLRRLQVEELALRSMLQPDNVMTKCTVVDANEISSDSAAAKLQKNNCISDDTTLLFSNDASSSQDAHK